MQACFLDLCLVFGRSTTTFVKVSVILEKTAGNLNRSDLGLAYFFLCFTQRIVSSSLDAVGFFFVPYYLVISYYQTSLAVTHKMTSK